MPTFYLNRILSETFVSEIEFQPTLGSTNDHAIELIRSRPAIPFPLLVLTELQTAGRGQANHRWLADHGSLTCSICLPGASRRDSRELAGVQLPRQFVSSEHSTLLPLIVANAVCEALESLDEAIEIKIKWPNDVLIDGGKVGGILIESVVAPDSTTVFVIGFGLNVNNEIDLDQLREHQAKQELPEPRIQLRPISLKSHLGQSIGLNEVLIRFLQQLERELATAGESVKRLIGKAEQRLIFLGQQVVVVSPDQREIVGECLGLGSWGELLLATEDGPVSFVSGQVIRFGDSVE